MQILEAVQAKRRGRPIGIAGFIEPGEKEMWDAIEIVANALDMEVDIRLATQEHLREKREAQKKVRSVDQIRVDSIARDRARRGTGGQARREAVEAAAAARKAEDAKKVIDSAIALLEDQAETPSDWGIVAAIRDALDSEYGVSRDA